MLTKWGLNNFKSIYSAEVELAPLTVLTGTNSSGKSSFIQSMLMVAQTIQSQFTERALILNGPLIELGKFEQVLSFDLKEIDKKLLVHFQIIPENASFKKLEFLLEFKKQGEHDDISRDSFSPVLIKTTQIAVTLGNEDIIISAEQRNFSKFAGIPSHKNKMLITGTSDYISKQLTESYQKLIVDLLKPLAKKHIAEAQHEQGVDTDGLVYDLLEKSIPENGADKDFEGVIKNELLSGLKSVFNMEDIMEKYFEKSLLSQFGLDVDTKKISVWILPNHFAVDKFIVPFVNKTEDAEKLRFTKKNDCYREISIGQISAAQEALSAYFTHSFKYLGPLRFREKLSPFSKAGDQRDVGITGEFTAAVYDAFKNKSIQYIAPAVFENIQQNDLYTTKAFSEALNEWLCYIGVSNGVDVEAEENGYKIKINSNDKHPVNLTHVGTGVSQVLPILVSCLLAEPGSTLVFEQPELHLHPRVQSRLADFFLSMALLGKQCIIETHSEYLIYALRYRISESLLKNDETIQNVIKLYFAEKNGGKSEFQEIKVNRHGEISAWPDGFFDERQKLSERMLDNILSETEDGDA